MWPFSTPKRVEIEPDGLAEDLADIKLRLKNLEREHDDLHAAYRRLRGGLAREQVGKAAPATPLDPSEGPNDPREPGWKDAMRRRHLHKPGNGS